MSVSDSMATLEWCANALLDDLEEHQDEVHQQGLARNSLDEVYLAEHCMVRLGTHRRSGHTTLAHKLAKEHPKSLLVVTSRTAADQAVDDGVPLVRTDGQVSQGQHLRGLDVETVIVDPSIPNYDTVHVINRNLADCMASAERPKILWLGA